MILSAARVISEIAAKSTAYAIGEIEHFVFGEIKSVPHTHKVGFRRETISPTEGGHEKKE